MEEIKDKYDYEPFADTEEYREVNEACIHGWMEIMRRKGLSGIEAILDVATGAGTMVQLVFDQLPASWRKAAVMCLDQSAEALRLAQSKLEKTVERLKFVHSSVEDMTIPDESIDVAAAQSHGALVCSRRRRAAFGRGGASSNSTNRA